MEETSRIAVDAAGNSYVVGRFYSTNLFFGNTALTNTPGRFLVGKFNRHGESVWTASLAAGFVHSQYVAVDNNGGVYILGSFYSYYGYPDFGQTNLSPMETGNEMFLAKYDEVGAFQWVKRFLSTNVYGIYPHAICASHSNVVVTFEFKGHASFGTDSLTNTDLGVAVLDQSGLLQSWVGIGPTSTNSGPYAFANDVRTTRDGGIYLAGVFTHPMFVVENHLLTNAGSLYNDDGFMLKLAPDLTCEWVRQIGSTKSDRASGMCVLPDGDLVVSAAFGGSGIVAGLSISNRGSILLRLTPDGSPVWLREVWKGETSGRLFSDHAGNIYLVSALIQNEPQLGITNIPGSVHAGILAKFSDDGAMQWFKLAQQTPRTNYLYTQYGGLSDVGVDGSGAVYGIGLFEGFALNFDSRTLTNQSSAPGMLNGWDSFVTRIDPESPRLSIQRDGPEILILWSTNQTGFSLQRSTALGTAWEPVGIALNITNSQFLHRENPTNMVSIFRLKLDE